MNSSANSNTNTNNKSRLFPYQVEGVNFLMGYDKSCFKGGFLLDEQGLGKTIQTITALSNLYDSEDIHKILIVCPAIMRATWEQEIDDWFVLPKDWSRLPVIQVVTKKTEDVSPDTTICICSYEYVTARYNKKSLLTENFDAVVLDESHKIKNPASQRTKACLQLLLNDKTTVRILLTGTPVTKGVDDLYTQLRPFYSPADTVKLLVPDSVGALSDVETAESLEYSTVFD